ncbi:hypothetical protein [Altererythrobacter lutimaris]
MLLQSINACLLMIGAEFGVNPYIFAAIYVGSTPVFLGALAWLISSAKAGRSIATPAVVSAASFMASYVYLAIAGEGLPLWVWLVAGIVVSFGGYSTFRSARRQIAYA